MANVMAWGNGYVTVHILYNQFRFHLLFPPPRHNLSFFRPAKNKFNGGARHSEQTAPFHAWPNRSHVVGCINIMFIGAALQSCSTFTRSGENNKNEISKTPKTYFKWHEKKNHPHNKRTSALDEKMGKRNNELIFSKRFTPVFFILSLSLFEIILSTDLRLCNCFTLLNAIILTYCYDHVNDD